MQSNTDSRSKEEAGAPVEYLTIDSGKIEKMIQSLEEKQREDPKNYTLYQKEIDKLEIEKRMTGREKRMTNEMTHWVKEIDNIDNKVGENTELNKDGLTENNKNKYSELSRDILSKKKLIKVIKNNASLEKSPLSEIVERPRYKWVKKRDYFTSEEIDLLVYNKYVQFDRKSVEELGPSTYGNYLNWIEEKIANGEKTMDEVKKKEKPLSKIVENNYKWEENETFDDKDIKKLAEGEYINFGDEETIRKLIKSDPETYGKYLKWIRDKDKEKEKANNKTEKKNQKAEVMSEIDK